MSVDFEAEVAVRGVFAAACPRAAGRVMYHLLVPDEDERTGLGFRILRKPGTPVLWSRERIFGMRPNLM